jgi:ribose-phosphate pyrophosphokinase
MEMTLLSGRAHPELASKVAAAMGAVLGECQIQTFPDDELQVDLQAEVAGRDVYLVQPLAPPGAGFLLESLLMADACRRRDAARLTAVVTYMGYARQDRRVTGREALGARVVADMLASRFDRVLAVDLHNPSIEGFFSVPLRHISAVPLLAEAMGAAGIEDHVVVAPDLGAAKLARRYAALLDLPVAYIHKERLGGRNVRVAGITGRVAHRRPLLVDDMISTGGTLASAVQALLAAGCTPPVTLAASHGLFVGPAAANLARLPLARVLVTDSLPPATTGGLPLEIVGLAGLLARSIEALR